MIMDHCYIWNSMDSQIVSMFQNTQAIFEVDIWWTKSDCQQETISDLRLVKNGFWISLVNNLAITLQFTWTLTGENIQAISCSLMIEWTDFSFYLFFKITFGNVFQLKK